MQIHDQNGILGEQPDKHDQSDLEVDIVFQSREMTIAQRHQPVMKEELIAELNNFRTERTRSKQISNHKNTRLVSVYSLSVNPKLMV
jgi:hypothetical protein